MRGVARGRDPARIPDGPGTDATEGLVVRCRRDLRFVVRCPRPLTMVGTARERLSPAKLRAGHEQDDQEGRDERSHGIPACSMKAGINRVYRAEGEKGTRVRRDERS